MAMLETPLPSSDAYDVGLQRPQPATPWRTAAATVAAPAWHSGAILDLRDAVLAGAVVKAATVPLERVTIPIFTCSRAARRGVWSVARDIALMEGWRGFFKGGLLDLLRGGAGRGITVGLVDGCQRALGVSDFAAGALAGAGQTLLLYPLEVVQTAKRAAVGPAPTGTALTASGDPTSLGQFRAIARCSGLRGFYPALAPSLAGVAGFYALQFGARRPIQEATGSPFLAGFLGSAFAFALCGWNNVVRLSMQRRAVYGEVQLSWLATLTEEYRAGGLARLYAGFGVKVVQTGASMGLVFAVYEWLRAARV